MSTTTIRLLYRRGLELEPGFNGWRLSCGESAHDFESIRQACGPEPLAVEQRWDNGQTRTSLLLPGNRMFGLERTWLQQRLMSNEYGGCRLEWFEVDYLLGAVGYHCLQLAEAYASVRRNFVRLNGARPTGMAGVQGLSDHLWYELDAFLSAARRTLEMSRYLLWNTYPRKGKGCPRNFVDLLDDAALPAPLHDQLRTTWERFGIRLSDYRDCIQHNTNLTRDHGGVLLDNRSHDATLVTGRLPDNPQAKSRQRFSYSQNLDALDYAYSITVEWIDVMKTVARHVKPHPDFDQD